MKTTNDLLRHKHRVTLCDQFFSVLLQEKDRKTNQSLKKKIVKPVHVHCNSYFCPICSRKRKREIYSRTLNGLKNETWRHLILTTNRNAHTDEEAIENITKAFNALFTVLRRMYKDIQFVRVIELNESNFCHLHVLINKYIPQQQIKKYWKRYFDTDIVFIKRAEKNKRLVGYLINYLGKSCQDEHQNELFFLHNKRRFSFSRNFERKLKPEKIFSMYRKGSYSLFDTFRIIENIDPSIFDFDFSQIPESG